MWNEEDGILLDRVSQPVFDRIEAGESLFSLPWPAQVLVVIYSGQGIIDNGGLVYFFERDWPDDTPYSTFVEAYRAIEATTVADCIASTVAALPFSEPHLECEARCAWLEAHESDEEFARCNDLVVLESGAVWSALAAYVRQHKDEIAAT